MTFLYSRKCLKYLEKLDRDTAKKLIRAIEQLPSSGDIRKLKTGKVQDLYRLRIGRYRVIYKSEPDIIRVLLIDARKDVYRKI